MWRCLNCGEESEDDFGICWNCQTEKGENSPPPPNPPAKAPQGLGGSHTEYKSGIPGTFSSASCFGISGGNFILKTAVLMNESDLIILNALSLPWLILATVFPIIPFLLRPTYLICLPFLLIWLIVIVVNWVSYFMIWRPFANGETEFLKAKKGGAFGLIGKHPLTSVSNVEMEQGKKRLTIHLASGKNIVLDSRAFTSEQLTFFHEAYNDTYNSQLADNTPTK